MTDKKILLFVGPSGSGKTLCIKSLQESMPETFEYIPSLTTREPRPDEDTWTYDFISNEEFSRCLDNEDLLQATQYDGNHYGTLKKDFQNALADNKIPMLAVTEDGVQAFIEAGYFPIVLRIDPYNFVPREGREAADANRPSLPAGGGYSYSFITLDWNIPPHQRKAHMLSELYAKVLRML